MTARPVQAWWDRLDFLAPDVRADFGRLIAELRRGLSTGAASPSNPDEPAGWTGMTRRAPWHRLLPSEWALADIVPEEFLRRAAEGELAFWELGHEAQQRERSIYLWLDVGPDQLGACRVVQIALMLWLQQLCLGSGGQFYWGTIQAPDKGYDKLQGQELRTFLTARSIEPARLPPERFDGVQTWCIGAPAWISSLPESFRRVALTQANAETVELRFQGRVLDLNMPPPEMAARLLRDPLTWRLPKPARGKVMDRAGALVFSKAGRKLLIAGKRDIAVLPIPSSFNEPPGRPRTYPLRYEGPVIALSMEGNAINLAQLHDEKWSFYRLNAGSVEPDFTCVPPLVDHDAAIGSCWKKPEHWYMWFDNWLYFVDRGARPAFRTRGGCHLGSESLLAKQSEIVRASGNRIYKFASPFFGRVHLSLGANLSVKGTEYVMAHELEQGEWRLLWQDHSENLVGNGTVLDVVADHRNNQAALLVERDGFLSLQRSTGQELLDILGPVGECTTHPNGLLAYRDVTGQPGIFSLHDRQPRGLGAL